MIRQLGVDDLTDFRALWLEGLERDAAAFLLTPEEGGAVPLEALRVGLAEGRHFGAFDGTEMVGIASLRRGGVARLRHMADLGPIYVTPEARRQGHAQRLIEAGVAHMAEQGVLQVELVVDASNAGAIALYRSLGFERIGLRPRSVIIDGTARDDVLMLRQLDT